jgi:hypothetical protein
MSNTALINQYRRQYDKGHLDGVSQTIKLETMAMIVAMNHAGGIGKKKICEIVDECQRIVHEFTADPELGREWLERECENILGEPIKFDLR